MLERLEALARDSEVQEITGIFNGTTNFLLDRIARGSRRDEAIREAQDLGLAEADPSSDLEGWDVVHKLTLLSRLAFGSEPPTWIERSGLNVIPDYLVRAHAVAGRVIRLVGTVKRTPKGALARVRCQILDSDHVLASVRGAENAIEIRLADGRVELLRGLGAGRWPTAHAVMADIRDLSQRRSRRPLPKRLRA